MFSPATDYLKRQESRQGKQNFARKSLFLLDFEPASMALYHRRDTLTLPSVRGDATFSTPI